MKRKSIWSGLVAALMLVPVCNIANADTLKIAIANFGEHPQLSAVAEGFKKEITSSGMSEGKDVVFTLDHVNFDTTLLPQMLAKINASQPDLVFAITTPVAQNALNMFADASYPMVFGAVTDPVAAGLVPSWEKGGKKMTGASDGLDIGATLKLVEKLFPKAETIGVPFNPGEANDVAMVASVKEAAKGTKFSVAEVSIDNTNEIPARVAALARKADLIYGSGSNLIQPAIAAVAASANEAKVPLLNSDDGPVRKGILPAAFSVSYTQIGHNAGKIALRLLKGEKTADIAPLRPAYEDHAITISRSAMDAIGAEIPAEFDNCDCIIK